MKKKTALLALLLAGVMSFGVATATGCKKKKTDNQDTNVEQPDDGNQGENPSPGHFPVIGEEDKQPVILSEDTAISLTAGETRQLSAASGTQFTSLHENVATVDSSGNISAKTAGVAKIKAVNGNSELVCTVIVLDKIAESSSGTAKDPFAFSKTVDIGSVTSSPVTPEVSDPNAAEFKVEFSDGAVTQHVANGCTVVEPLVENDGNYLTGWKATGASSNYDFATPVTTNLVLNAQWESLPAGVNKLEGNYESIAVEFDGTAASSTVSYRLHGSSDSWHQIDKELIRDDGGSVRADIVGIKAGVYDVKVNSTELTAGVPVKKYDRSGYAHFNYTSGIGAYKDDGTLKDNALVIYVTEENKDTVMNDICALNSDVNMFNIPTYSGTPGKDWGGKAASGIGWWLNNAQYTMNNATSSSNKRPSNTYDAANGGNLGFKSVNRPIVLRFIGTVTAPEGCTAYDSEDQGGSCGDNGNMVRMKNLKDVTIEGIGDDAQIKGWGFHFIAGGDAKDGRGKGFEVRNLTFNEYPEDAVGMEGQQEGTAITAPVERCWIHNNTFLPGRCDNPAESDKAEGDGSCDFKRGQYFTCSYNYFEYCHKTNLVGSSDSSLQFNMTYHHNIWYQCGSRIPLTRHANVHFYNNYVFGDPTETSTPYSHISKPSLSYVHSLRASCYIFSEANYYEGCKNVTDGKNGGAAKAYNNTFYACSDGGTGSLTLVSSREQKVNNSCAYQTTDYSSFDTNPTQFYYDAATKTTKTEILDDSIGARIRASLYAGAQGHGQKTARLQVMNTSAPITSPNITKPVKGKGQVVTFSVAANTTLTIDATETDPQVIRNDGKVYLEPFSGQRTVMLDAGTYMVCSGIKSKEIVINSMSVQEDSAAAKKARVEEAKKAIAAIPDKVQRSSGNVIKQAAAAYANLITAEERTELGTELTERLKKAQTAYEEVLIDYAIARIEYIGEVTPASGNDIKAAEDAYTAVSAASHEKVTNYNKLTQAQTAFNGFKGDTIKGTINSLPKSSSFELITDSRPAIELAITLFKSALNEYSALDKQEDADIIKAIDITPVTQAIETFTGALKPFDVKDMIAEISALQTSDATYMTLAGNLSSAYSALTDSQKAMITADEKNIYDTVMAAYKEFASKAVSITFIDGNPSNSIIKNTGAKHSKKGKEFIVNAYSTTEKLKSGLKLESSTELTLTLATKMTVTFYLWEFNAVNTVAVDGVAVELKQVGGDNVATVTLEAGEHKIKRAKSENSLYYLTLVPAE